MALLDHTLNLLANLLVVSATPRVLEAGRTKIDRSVQLRNLLNLVPAIKKIPFILAGSIHIQRVLNMLDRITGGASPIPYTSERNPSIFMRVTAFGKQALLSDGFQESGGVRTHQCLHFQLAGKSELGYSTQTPRRSSPFLILSFWALQTESWQPARPFGEISETNVGNQFH